MALGGEHFVRYVRMKSGFLLILYSETNHSAFLHSYVEILTCKLMVVGSCPLGNNYVMWGEPA